MIIMNISEFIENYKRHVETSSFDKFNIAVFNNKQNELCFALIRESNVGSIEINTYTKDCDLASEVKLNPLQNCFYLYNLYTNKNYRNLSITTNVIELIDYIVSNKIKSYIYGIFEPFEYSHDRKIQIFKEEYENRAEQFYRKNGFTLIKYEDYINNRELYKDFNICDFGLHTKKTLLYKKIEPKEQNYILIDGIIVHKNALENIEEIKEILKPKTLKLTI